MTGQLADVLSFRRITGIPVDAYLAVLESWQLTGHDDELCLGGSMLRGRSSTITTSVPGGSRSVSSADGCARRRGCGWKSRPGMPAPQRSNSSRASG